MSEPQPLTREQVVSIYRQVLGRTPGEQEIAHQLATMPTLDAMLRVALDSDEYRARLASEGQRLPRTPSVVNVFHPELAQWGHPVGRRSDDQIAIIGHDGWLFLCGGTNANLGQYVGEVTMEPGWVEAWSAALRAREEDRRELDVAAVTVVVPDKLAVYEERYPEPLRKVGPRPVERLLDARLPLVYPLAELRAAAAREEVYLRTDTHLTLRGNELLFEAVRAALGVQAPVDLSTLPIRAYCTSGDLGVKFEPPIVEVMGAPHTLHRARIAEDNREAVAATGAHVGTRRVFVNDAAPDARVAVIFGDSFGFAAEHYQGLSWFLAQVFRETHFVWAPFGWDPGYVRAVGAAAVVVQGAERFIARVPSATVDVGQVIADVLGPETRPPLAPEAAPER
jgi:alginate O-acetyltransferase complex protein AlgJ